MTRVIHISNRDVWDSIEKHAGKMSVSSYLIGLHFTSVEAAKEKIYPNWRSGIKPDPKVEG